MSRMSMTEVYCRLKKQSLESASTIIHNELEEELALHCESTKNSLQVSPTVRNDLEEELAQLRESTKKSLQESQEELKSLREKLSANTKIIAQKDAALARMIKKKKAWQERCLVAEEELQVTSVQQTIPDQEATPDQKDELHCPMRMSFPLSRWSWKAHNTALECKEASKDEEEVDLKIACRDSTILSLEHTLNENIKYFQKMEIEIKSLVEKQELQEKEIHDFHIWKEERLKEDVNYNCAEEIIGHDL